MTAGAAALPIDADRLIGRQEHMNRIGATPRGGVHRLALSDEDNQARADIVGWARARGFAVSVDPVGNIFLTRPGRGAGAAPVMAGSHTDSQPYAGRYDGMSGVLAAFEALEALEDADIETECPVTTVIWTGEEGGARFPVGTIGSTAFSGRRSIADTLALKDPDGISVGEALERTFEVLGDVPRRELGFPVRAYLELHIEQGPVLEQAGLRIGAVTLVQGMRRFAVDVAGEEAHSGTTPLRTRRDALKDAIRIIADLEETCSDPEDVVRFTVGRLDVRPNAAAVVSGHARFVIDLRHPEVATLDRLTAAIRDRCREHNGPCTVTVEEINRIETTVFDERIVSAVESAAASLSIGSMRMISGANHDASHLASLCPAGMLFVPCRRGISHSEAEHLEPEDLVAGARILAGAILDLAGGNPAVSPQPSRAEAAEPKGSRI